MYSKSVSKLFYNLGIPLNLKGYPFLVYLVSLTVPHDYPIPTLKELYAQTGSHFGVSAAIVSEDIRTVLKNYWNQGNAKRFTQTLRYPVIDKLTTKEFVSIVAAHIRSHS